MAAELTWERALAARMRRQRLVERAPAADLLDVARGLCGLHAQVMSSAELTAWARVDGLARGDVERALWERGELVKQWAMRGTLHLLPAADLPTYHAAFATFRHYLRPSWLREFGYGTPERLEAALAALDATLTPDASLSRADLAAAIAERTGDADLATHLAESWGSALKPAAFRGLLAFGPSDGQQVRFRRAPDTAADRPDADAAFADLTRRYLHAYGPARRDDLARWWGGGSMLTAAAAQKRMEALGDEVVAVDVEGERCWMLAADLADTLGGAGEPPHAARLLPLFDQWTVSLNRNVDAILAPERRPLVYRQAGWISPVVLVDGAIAGTWKHETTKGPDVTVTLEPFGKLPRWAAEQLDAEAERLRQFLGATTRRGTS